MKKIFSLCQVAALALFLVSCGSSDSDSDQPTPLAEPRNWALSRTFQENGQTFAPANFEAMRLQLAFSVPAATARGIAEIELRATGEGFSYFLCEGQILSAQLDGKAISVSARPDPDGLNTLLVISKPLRKGERYQLRLEYVVPQARISFQANGVGFLTSMSDLGRGNFFEAYAPASFEYDAFPLRLELRIEPGTAPLPAHRIFANGEIQTVTNSHWKVDFPSYFTSSSFYLHLTSTPLFVRQATYQGKEKSIPITVYSHEEALATQAIDMLPALFRELEDTYGAYAHGSFLAYISGGRGGMEYSGATITSLAALGHELTHSWFARGVMPSDGRSGWIDEAIASWRDNGYFRASEVGQRPATNLARISAFQRFTLPNSYVDGRALLSEFDLLFSSQGGLRPVLRDFFHAWKRKSIRTTDFRLFLEEKSGTNLGPLFQKYVYADTSFSGDAESASFPEGASKHPPPLTEEELRHLR
jgi:hypothetical protein